MHRLNIRKDQGTRIRHRIHIGDDPLAHPRRYIGIFGCAGRNFAVLTVGDLIQGRNVKALDMRCLAQKRPTRIASVPFHAAVKLGDLAQRLLALADIEQIEEMERTMTGAELNKAKEILAYELTNLIHGKEEADRCLEAAKAIFANGGVSADMPTTEIPAAELEGGINILDLLVKTGLCPSKSEGRRLVQQNGIAVDDAKVTDPNAMIEIANSVVIKKGKKVFHKAARV